MGDNTIEEDDTLEREVQRQLEREIERLSEQLLDPQSFDTLFTIDADAEVLDDSIGETEHFGNKSTHTSPPYVGGTVGITINLYKIQTDIPLAEIPEKLDLLDQLCSHGVLYERLEDAVGESMSSLPGSLRDWNWEFGAPVVDKKNKTIYIQGEFSAEIELDPFPGYIGEYD